MAVSYNFDSEDNIYAENREKHDNLLAAQRELTGSGSLIKFAYQDIAGKEPLPRVDRTPRGTRMGFVARVDEINDHIHRETYYGCKL